MWHGAGFFTGGLLRPFQKVVSVILSVHGWVVTVVVVIVTVTLGPQGFSLPLSIHRLQNACRITVYRDLEVGPPVA